MTKNILIAIGAAGFLSLSHADSDILQEQLTDQGQAEVLQKVEQKQEKESFSALKSFLGGASASFGGSLLFRHNYIKQHGLGDFFQREINNFWKIDVRTPNIFTTACLSGLFRVIFDFFESKIAPSNLTPYVKGFFSYTGTALSTFSGRAVNKIGDDWCLGLDIDYKSILPEAGWHAFYATVLHLAFNAITEGFTYPYNKKKNSQEDKKSQETQDQATA